MEAYDVANCCGAFSADIIGALKLCASNTIGEDDSLKFGLSVSLNCMKASMYFFCIWETICFYIVVIARIWLVINNKC